MSDHERFAQVAHKKWATMSESFRALTKNELFAEKTDEQIPSPGANISNYIYPKSMTRIQVQKRYCILIRICHLEE